MRIKIPQSTIEILELLQDGELYSIDLITEVLSQFDIQTLRYAIRRLLELKIVQSIPDLYDMRTVKYRISPQLDTDEISNRISERIYIRILTALDNSYGQKDAPQNI